MICEMLFATLQIGLSVGFYIMGHIDGKKQGFKLGKDSNKPFELVSDLEEIEVTPSNLPTINKIVLNSNPPQIIPLLAKLCVNHDWKAIPFAKYANQAGSAASFKYKCDNCGKVDSPYLSELSEIEWQKAYKSKNDWSKIHG